QAFWMTTMEERSSSEVAAILGISKGNVYAAKYRVITRIQDAVERFDINDDDQSLKDFTVIKHDKK
ncbi:MAG: hypothetical protein AAF623_02110, partial [Planctomycetota bacterium]